MYWNKHHVVCQFAFFDLCAGNHHHIVVGESCERNTNATGWAGESSKSGSTNRAFMQVWHKLHIMLLFGTCLGGNSENGAENMFPAHYKECSLGSMYYILYVICHF